MSWRAGHTHWVALWKQVWKEGTCSQAISPWKREFEEHGSGPRLFCGICVDWFKGPFTFSGQAQATVTTSFTYLTPCWCRWWQPNFQDSQHQGVVVHSCASPWGSWVAQVWHWRVLISLIWLVTRNKSKVTSHVKDRPSVQFSAQIYKTACQVIAVP